ncbi:MAG: aminopeptidase P family protein [Clostridia bacterium]|nr:aminopeptidase P family protein [Clostridia bacterium]
MLVLFFWKEVKNIFRKDILNWLKECDGVLLAKPESMRSFCGYTGEGFVLFDKKDCYIITDSRYQIQAGEQAPDAVVLIISGQKGHFQIIRELVLKSGVKKVAFEDDYWTVSAFESLRKIVPDLQFLTVGDSLTRWRMKKDSQEIEKIRCAAGIADKAFSEALVFLHEGITEREAAWKLEQSLRNNGAEALSFDTIMAFGENGAKPHAIPGERPLKNGDMIVMDFGCKYKGYCSDMTRTVAWGSVDEKAQKVYGIVLDAQLAALRAIKPGITGEEVDMIAREIITQNGYGAYFGHGLGHGVGLEIHELPRLAQGQIGRIVLEPGHVVTDEPGIYLPGEFGVRIEDLCLVTDNGVEVLSNSSKELIVIQHS